MKRVWKEPYELSNELLPMFIAEEAGEIVQAAFKVFRFGPFSYDPRDSNSDTNNYIDLIRKFRDLLELVNEFDGRFGSTLDDARKPRKRLVFEE